jgi:hypothetical protein
MDKMLCIPRWDTYGCEENVAAEAPLLTVPSLSKLHVAYSFDFTSWYLTHNA